jgi:uncharacterized membrane protein
MSNSQFFIMVLGMGLATYATRLAGYWFLRDVPLTGRRRAMMDAVPPAVLTAVIAPQVFLQGKAEMLAGAAALAAAMLRLPLLAVIGIGMACVAVFRQIL